MNKVIVSGRIARDLVLNYMADGDCVLNFAVATTEVYFSEGERKETTEFHAVVAFGKKAKTISEHFKKGYGILIEGKQKTRSYQHKEYPIKIYKTEIHLDEFDFPIAPPKSSVGSNQENHQQNSGFERGSVPEF